MIERLLMKSEIYRNKVDEVNSLKGITQKMELEIKNKNSMILDLKEKNKKLHSELKNRDKFKFIAFMVIQMKKLED
uniref:hypothetical protein n=1 Tax=Clostridium perfringens TaxID=1502 RepID=UPI0032DBD187